MTRARFSILTMMKDEGPFLLEWLAFHHLIGFDAIWVYSNDCRDGTDAMLDRLQAMGLLHHLPNDVPEGRAPQPNALTLGQKNTALLDTDWLLVMDADEFLHVKCGDGRVQDLIAAVGPGVEGVAVTWRMMGSNGHETAFPGPVLSSYTKGAPDGFRKSWGVKTLFRPFPDLKLGIHRPTVKGAKRDAARMQALQSQIWVNGSGQRMPPSFMADGWRGSAATVGRDLVELAHFATRSLESYLLRGDRGNVNLKPDKYDATYFAMFDRNEEAHDGLARRSAKVMDLVQEWLTDPDLRALQDQSLAWHHARLDTLRTAPGYTTRMAALRAASQVPYEGLDKLLFTQPLAPRGKRVVAEMQEKGIPNAEIARFVAQSVGKLEAERDAREAAELREMGIEPRG